MAILDLIEKENDIKQLSADQLRELPSEIRSFLLQHVSETGGHIASNLGGVELTIALHLMLDFPKDKLIWDVGHQSYVHKMLTGRKDQFDHLRQLGGMSGFPKREESPCDSFDTGHSSTSISAGLGYAYARDLRGEDYSIVSVIGDGALTGGLAYEALNNAADLKTNFIIVLNDNEMSISKNVGGFSRHLASLRTAESYQEFKSDVHSSLEKLPYGEHVARRMHKTKSSLKQLLIPGMIFENLGITYLGPVNGHSIPEMVGIFREAKKVNGAVVVHVLTEKGKGYEPAELKPDRFHGIGPWNLETGLPKAEKTKANYTDIFSSVMCKIAAEHENVVGITAAMADGTGLNRFRKEYPERFFDVGIAEGHAVTFAAGLACAGIHPVVAVYSSFLQRGFDQIVYDVCLQKLPVTFAIDRAGLVGADGKTHQGSLDLSYLSMIPNMTVMAPKNKWELADMLRFAVEFDGPTAIRYPRGKAYEGLREYRAPIVYGKSEWIYKETGVALYCIGNMVKTAEAVYQALKERGIPCSLINARFAKPIDTDCLREIEKEHKLLVTMEENAVHGGFGDMVGAAHTELELQIPLLKCGIPDEFVPHGTVQELHELIQLDAASLTERILARYQELE